MHSYRYNCYVLHIYSHTYGSDANVKSYVILYNYAVNENSQTVSETSAMKSDEEKCEVFIGIVVVFFATSVIAMAVIAILAWKLCSEKRKSGKP